MLEQCYTAIGARLRTPRIFRLAIGSAPALILSAAGATAAPLFDDESPLKVVLTAPITQTYRQRNNDDRLYFPGHWSFSDEAGTPVRLDVQIRTRGNFRRELCKSPPLQLNFRKSQVKGTLFRGQDKIKLVGPCQKGARSEQLLLLEYLAYRVYAELTDFHYATRLLQLNVVDTDKKNATSTYYAFVIESDEDTAKRYTRKPVIDSVQPDQLDAAQTAVLEIFQFLIGNNDYSTIRAAAGRDCCHNVKLFADADSGTGIVPIPYDFDHAGLVDARYAEPPEKLPIKSVRQRYFTGRCKPDPGSWQQALETFRQKRAAVRGVFERVSALEEKTRNRALKYVDQFYKILDDPRQTDKQIIQRCRG